MAAVALSPFNRETVVANLARVEDLPPHIRVAEEAALKAILASIDKGSPKAPVSSGVAILNEGRVCLGFVNKAKKEADPAHHTYTTMSGGIDPTDLKIGESVIVNAAARELSEETHGYFGEEEVRDFLLGESTTILENAGMREGRWVGPICVLQISDQKAFTLVDDLKKRAFDAVREAQGQRVEVTNYSWFSLSTIFYANSSVQSEYEAKYAELRKASDLSDAEFKKESLKNRELQQIYDRVVEFTSANHETFRLNAAARRTFAHSYEQLKPYLGIP